MFHYLITTILEHKYSKSLGIWTNLSWGKGNNDQLILYRWQCSLKIYLDMTNFPEYCQIDFFLTKLVYSAIDTIHFIQLLEEGSTHLIIGWSFLILINIYSFIRIWTYDLQFFIFMFLSVELLLHDFGCQTKICYDRGSRRDKFYFLF